MKLLYGHRVDDGKNLDRVSSGGGLKMVRSIEKVSTFSNFRTSLCQISSEISAATWHVCKLFFECMQSPILFILKVRNKAVCICGFLWTATLIQYKGLLFCLFAGLQLHKKVDSVFLEKNLLIVVMILAYLQIVHVLVVIVHWVNPVR